MTNDELRRELRGMGMSQRVLNGHRVERLFVDMWIVDSNTATEDMAVQRITAGRGPVAGGDVQDFLLVLADHPKGDGAS